MKERERCGRVERTYGLACDRWKDHDGNHRGYLEQHDQVLFWGRDNMDEMPQQKGDGRPAIRVPRNLSRVEH